MDISRSSRVIISSVFRCLGLVSPDLDAIEELEDDGLILDDNPTDLLIR